MRIPDIYENESNKQAFGQFLENCSNATKEDQIIKEIIKLDALSTSIYSGILRLSDLAFSFSDNQTLFIIIPNNREKEVVLQLRRPSIKNNKVSIKYILFSDLREHCDALCKFGDSHKILEKIAKTV